MLVIDLRNMMLHKHTQHHPKQLSAIFRRPSKYPVLQQRRILLEGLQVSYGAAAIRMDHSHLHHMHLFQVLVKYPRGGRKENQPKNAFIAIPVFIVCSECSL